MLLYLVSAFNDAKPFTLARVMWTTVSLLPAACHKVIASAKYSQGTPVTFWKRDGGHSKRSPRVTILFDENEVLLVKHQ